MAQEAAVPAGFWARVQKMIDDSIAKYARSGPLRNASITGGAGLTIADGGQFRAKYPADLGGGTAFYVGPLYSAADPTQYVGTGLLVQGPDGSDLMTMRTDAHFGTTMQNIYDSQQNIIFGNDAASAQGLARPYIGAAFYPARYVDMTVGTTSTTFETLWSGTLYKQHPKLIVGASATMDASGGTGEVRVLVNGVQLGSTVSTTFAIVSSVYGPAAVAGDHMSSLLVEIQARVTSATGTCKVRPGYMVGRQS